jgi:hypothetical protein
MDVKSKRMRRDIGDTGNTFCILRMNIVVLRKLPDAGLTL